MKKRMTIIVISMMIGILFMSGGYGFWQKSLFIDGDIEVLQPEPQASSETIAAGGEYEKPDKINLSSENNTNGSGNNRGIDTNIAIGEGKNDKKTSAIEVSRGQKLNEVGLSKETSTTDTTYTFEPTDAPDPLRVTAPTESSNVSSNEISDNPNGSSDSSNYDSRNNLDSSSDAASLSSSSSSNSSTDSGSSSNSDNSSDSGSTDNKSSSDSSSTSESSNSSESGEE